MARVSHHELNARRLLCPMPVIRAQQFIQSLAAGDTLDVICTDPGAKNDIPAWCRIHGHRVLDMRSADRDIIITIEVGPGVA
jgi:tRNA 2-thiouridine synthesizing protein A